MGYQTDPSDTYCNKFSAYWDAGVDDCGNDNLDEEWCADFAAWVWKQAGAEVTYQLAPGLPQRRLRQLLRLGDGPRHLAPGRVGLHAPSRATSPSTGSTPPPSPPSTWPSSPPPRATTPRPTSINGDGDRTGYSVVEVGDNQAFADVKRKGAPLSGYVSPTLLGGRRLVVVSGELTAVTDRPADAPPLPAFRRRLLGLLGRHRHDHRLEHLGRVALDVACAPAAGSPRRGRRSAG